MNSTFLRAHCIVSFPNASVANSLLKNGTSGCLPVYEITYQTMINWKSAAVHLFIHIMWMILGLSCNIWPLCVERKLLEFNCLAKLSRSSVLYLINCGSLYFINTGIVHRFVCIIVLWENVFVLVGLQVTLPILDPIVYFMVGLRLQQDEQYYSNHFCFKIFIFLDVKNDSLFSH